MYEPWLSLKYNYLHWVPLNIFFHVISTVSGSYSVNLTVFHTNKHSIPFHYIHHIHLADTFVQSNLQYIICASILSDIGKLESLQSSIPCNTFKKITCLSCFELYYILESFFLKCSSLVKNMVWDFVNLEKPCRVNTPFSVIPLCRTLLSFSICCLSVFFQL